MQRLEGQRAEQPGWLATVGAVAEVLHHHVGFVVGDGRFARRERSTAWPIACTR